VARPPVPRRQASHDAIHAGAKSIRAGGTAATLLLGGDALRGKALEFAGRIAAKTGCRVYSEFNTARQESGAGRVDAPRLPFNVDQGLAMMSGTTQLILIGAKPPVTFFAYPGKPSTLVPPGCAVTDVADVGTDLQHAMAALADELGASNTPPALVTSFDPGPAPTGKPTIEGIGAAVTHLIPENAIICDEGITTGRNFGARTKSARPHEWMGVMGGSIGWGLPAGVGAALAAPDRKVIVFEGDGSGMYTNQALWTMARENLDVTMLIFANRSYQVLQTEFKNVGAGQPGFKARDMLTLDRPDPDWVAIARGYGVDASRATDLEGLMREMKRALAVNGPYLVELVI